MTNEPLNRWLTVRLEPEDPSAPDIRYGLPPELEDVLGQSSSALARLGHFAATADSYELYYVARIFYEIFNRPKAAISALWKALRDPESRRVAIEEYLDEIYKGTRGLSLQQVENLIRRKIDEKFHDLLDTVRPQVDLIILEHGDFDWEYDPGYYDAEWEGQGPNDMPPSLKVRPRASEGQ